MPNGNGWKILMTTIPRARWTRLTDKGVRYKRWEGEKMGKDNDLIRK